MKREAKRLREKEQERLKVQEKETQMKQNELKAMIREIQEEVQNNVTGQVMAMLSTFIKDVGGLLRYFVNRERNNEQDHEETMETTQAMEVLQQFNLEDSESDTTGNDGYINLESSFSSKEENTKWSKRHQGLYPRYVNDSKGKQTEMQYRRGRKPFYYE